MIIWKNDSSEEKTSRTFGSFEAVKQNSKILVIKVEPAIIPLRPMYWISIVTHPTSGPGIPQTTVMA
jgi:hypothetical protein